MPKIILTGGGSAGHVTPNLAMIPALQQRGWTLAYIGTHDGIERKLIGDAIPYYPISAGKLRRYFDWKNFTDPFRVLKGVYDAWRVLRRHR
ncbi:MAG: glycosyltransferase, partial [Limnochordia bacterium]